MANIQPEKLFKYLERQNWRIFGCVEMSSEEKKEVEEISPYIKAHWPADFKLPKFGDLNIKEIDKFSDLVLSDELPAYSWKNFFVPESEILFEYKSGVYKSSLRQPADSLYERGEKKIALFGVNLLDLKAVNLYDAVFAKDPYYQKRRKNILIIGYANNLKKDIYGRDYEPGILKHARFDIFLYKKDKLKIFIGSLRGRRILEHFGHKNYEEVSFEGPAVDLEKMNGLRNKLKNYHDQKIWDELGRRCVECGKCAIVCPTCFCFRIDDEVGLTENAGMRQRCWDSCFFQEFSEVAGPSLRSTQGSGQAGKPKFLKTTAERIHFWYYHKFARIPDEFGIIGCVGCLRCHKVCPVGIDIKEVLEEVKKS